METFFEHSPTPSEIESLIGSMSQQEYLESLKYSPEGENLLFIALLYEKRKDNTSFEKYRNQVSDLYKQWQWGLDNVAIPIE